MSEFLKELPVFHTLSWHYASVNTEQNIHSCIRGREPSTMGLFFQCAKHPTNLTLVSNVGSRYAYGFGEIQPIWIIQSALCTFKYLISLSICVSYLLSIRFIFHLSRQCSLPSNFLPQNVFCKIGWADK